MDIRLRSIGHLYLIILLTFSMSWAGVIPGQEEGSVMTTSGPSGESETPTGTSESVILRGTSESVILRGTSESVILRGTSEEVKKLGIKSEKLEEFVGVTPTPEDLLKLTQMEEADAKMRQEWGGTCGMEEWRKCYNVTVIGNPTIVNPLFPDDPKRNVQTQLDCLDRGKTGEFPWICLKNGWTVNRCHILCMSKCNRGLLLTRNWDSYVLHEGTCKVRK